MKIVQASAVIESPVDGMAMLKAIELAGRVTHKSESRITDDSALKFVRKMLNMKHESTIEHAVITVRFINDRGISHETVRHRIGMSPTQESTRYCNYADGKFGEEITVVDIKEFMDQPSYVVWLEAMADAERHYFKLVELGNKAQIARSVLPNSLKTEIVLTGNARAWRHFFSLRTPKSAHPQMREVAIPLLKEFRERIPVLFDDVGTLGDSNE